MNVHVNQQNGGPWSCGPLTCGPLLNHVSFWCVLHQCKKLVCVCNAAEVPGITICLPWVLVHCCKLSHASGGNGQYNIATTKVWIVDNVLYSIIIILIILIPLCFAVYSAYCICCVWVPHLYQPGAEGVTL